MKNSIKGLLIAVAGIAATVAVADAVGAGWWRRTAAIASMDSTRAVRRIAADWPLAIPEAVHRSRRLVARDVGAAPAADLIAALDRLARLQRWWFHTDPVGFKNAARAALIRGRLTEAEVWLRSALVRSPSAPELHRLMAFTLMGLGRRNDGLGHLAEARGLAAGLTGSSPSLSAEETRWVRTEGLERALDLYPRQRARTAIALARELRLNGSIDRGRTALETEVAHPEVELELAAWDCEAGQLEEAAVRLESIAGRALIPASLRARAWAKLAELRDLQGDSAAAARAAGRALDLDPSSPAPHLALASLAERRGDRDQALRHLRTAWGLTPSDVRLLTRIAQVAEAAGELNDARLALQRAVQLDPESVVQAARLVDFELRNGQYMDAALDLGRFLDRFPTDPTLLRLADRLQREVTR